MGSDETYVMDLGNEERDWKEGHGPSCGLVPTTQLWVAQEQRKTKKRVESVREDLKQKLREMTYGKELSGKEMAKISLMSGII